MKKKKSGGRDFQVGNPGGPGRPPVAPEVRALMKGSSAEIVDTIVRCLNSSRAELEALLEDESAAFGKKIIAKVLIVAYDAGDVRTVEMLWQRAVGKVKDQVDVHMFKPSILVRQDGTEVEFTNKVVDPEQEPSNGP